MHGGVSCHTANQEASKQARKQASKQASTPTSKPAGEQGKHGKQSKRSEPPKQASKHPTAQASEVATKQTQSDSVNASPPPTANRGGSHVTPRHATPHQVFSQDEPRPHGGLFMYFHSPQESSKKLDPNLLNTPSPLQFRTTIAARFPPPRSRGLTTRLRGQTNPSPRTRLPVCSRTHSPIIPPAVPEQASLVSEEHPTPSSRTNNSPLRGKTSPLQGPTFPLSGDEAYPP